MCVRACLCCIVAPAVYWLIAAGGRRACFDHLFAYLGGAKVISPIAGDVIVWDTANRNIQVGVGITAAIVQPLSLRSQSARLHGRWTGRHGRLLTSACCHMILCPLSLSLSPTLSLFIIYHFLSPLPVVESFSLTLSLAISFLSSILFPWMRRLGGSRTCRCIGKSTSPTPTA